MGYIKRSGIPVRTHSESLKMPRFKNKMAMRMVGNDHTLGHKLSKEHREKVAKAGIGRRHSEETRKKMSIIRKRVWESRSLEEKQDILERGIHSVRKNRYTKLEKILYAILDDLNVDYVPQQYTLGFYPDAFCASLGIAFEADGAYWHSKHNKIARTKGVKKALTFRAAGIRTIFFKERDLVRDRDRCIKRIMRTVSRRKRCLNAIK